LERVVWTERRSREAEVIKKSNRRSEIEAKGGRKGGEGRAEEVEVQVEVEGRRGKTQGTSSAIMETAVECLRPSTLGLHLLSLQR
jgi:hypothetical protein